MVTFKIVEETDEYLLYWYYAEGNESLKPGIIIVDKINGKIDITELAEDDWERDISVEELNELAESVNREIREEGGTDFLELATEPEHRRNCSEKRIEGLVLRNLLRNKDVWE